MADDDADALASTTPSPIMNYVPVAAWGNLKNLARELLQSLSDLPASFVRFKELGNPSYI